MKRRLLANRIITPDGTMLQSFDRHHYVAYTDKNGYEYSVDGGLEYQRCSYYEDAPHTDASVYSDDPHQVIREAFLWGTYGKNGDQPLKRVKLCAMTDKHIQAILETQHHIPDHVREIFENEVLYRELTHTYVEETE